MRTTNTIKFQIVMKSFIVLVLLLFSAPCFADAPISIQADLMTSVDKSQNIVFTGNVDAKQGDIRIRSDKMTVYYKEKDDSSKTQKSSQEVEKIVCEGNVEITNEDWLGTSEVMHYYSQKSLVQLIGNAKAYQGQNMVQGARIHHNLDTGKSEVFRGDTTIDSEKPKEESGRVNMTILQ